MSRTPPLLPLEAFVRVVRVARFDGMGVLAVAGVFAVLSALSGDRGGAIVGLLVAGAGAVELHGATLLQHGEPRGTNWLMGSQVFLMLTILGYCQYRLANMDLTLLRAAMTPELKTQLEGAGWTIDEFLQFTYRLSWIMIAVVTIIYQGGMTLYYLRRRNVVVQALTQEN